MPLRGRVDENSGETSTRLASIDSIGRQLLELEAPVDAMRAYSSTLERRVSEDPADDWGTGTGWESITRGVELALSAVRNTDQSILLDELLLEKTGDGPAVDLVAVVFPREPDRAALFSVFDDLVNRAASDLQFLAMMSTRLERLRQARPRDIAVQIACALVALAEGRNAAAAVERLERLVNEMPLDKLPTSGRPSCASKSPPRSRLFSGWRPARA